MANAAQRWALAGPLARPLGRALADALGGAWARALATALAKALARAWLPNLRAEMWPPGLNFFFPRDVASGAYFFLPEMWPPGLIFFCSRDVATGAYIFWARSLPSTLQRGLIKPQFRRDVASGA